MSHPDPSVEELLDEDNFDAEIEAEKAEALRDAQREDCAEHDHAPEGDFSGACGTNDR